MTEVPHDNAELGERVHSLVVDLARASRIEIWLGAAHETFPPSKDGVPLLVLDEPAVVSRVREALAGCVMTPRTVVPALAGLSLVWLDDGEFCDRVELVSSRWVRYSWPYDAIAAGSVLPIEVLEQLRPSIWPSGVQGT